MIADGYQLLLELGAVDERDNLTPIGASSPSCRSTRASRA